MPLHKRYRAQQPYIYSVTCPECGAWFMYTGYISGHKHLTCDSCLVAPDRSAIRKMRRALMLRLAFVGALAYIAYNIIAP